MTKAPTNTAITAKISMKVLKNERPSWTPVWASFTTVCAGDGLVARGQHALDALGQLLLRHARLGRGRDVRERVAEAGDLLGGRRVEQGDRRSERAVGAAELAQPDDGHVVGARGGHDLHLVTDGEVVALGRGRVHDHLVGSLRGRALGHLEGVELRVARVVDGQGRRALVAGCRWPCRRGRRTGRSSGSCPRRWRHPERRARRSGAPASMLARWSPSSPASMTSDERATDSVPA